MFGVSGGTNCTGGTGVYGYNNAATGQVAGVSGSAASSGSQSAGVFGFESAATGQVYGVVGGTGGTGPNATGVFGYESATSGSVYGVWGTCSSPSGAGVYGSNSAAGGLAGLFSGNVNVNGTLHVSGAITAGTKDFQIDHPVDPDHKYLYHASAESSEMMNIYSGNATLDGKGEAEVDLPAWFEALNGDFRYQLTPVG
ncbi:MAG: hypothetical protein WBQ76_03190, partial [Candidatus Korobacteraceae bacterium]